MRKLRLKRGACGAHSHPASKWQSWNSDPPVLLVQQLCHVASDQRDSQSPAFILICWNLQIFKKSLVALNYGPLATHSVMPYQPFWLDSPNMTIHLALNVSERSFPNNLVSLAGHSSHYRWANGDPKRLGELPSSHSWSGTSIQVCSFLSPTKLSALPCCLFPRGFRRRKQLPTGNMLYLPLQTQRLHGNRTERVSI